MFIYKKSKSHYIFKTGPHTRIHLFPLLNHKKKSSNSLGICVTSGKKIVHFMKSYSMLCLRLLHSYVNLVNTQQGTF